MPIETVETVSGTSLQYYLVAFDATGREREESGQRLSDQLVEDLSHEPITDVFLMSHGWQGDVPAARRQYGQWIGAMAAHRADLERLRRRRPGFRPLLIGLHWPSLPWGDEALAAEPVSFSPTAASPDATFVTQYAERIADTPPARQALDVIFTAARQDPAPVELPPEVAAAYAVLNHESSLGAAGAAAEPGSDRDPFDPEGLFQAAQEEEPVSFGDFPLKNLRNALLAPLRGLSFWKMKDRARQFGENGVFPLLNRLQQAGSDRVRFHLMGHSFGCIVVSAGLAGPAGRGRLVRPVQSLTLAQGALSLWSYGAAIPGVPGRAGYFHALVADGKVAGPIITTHSEFDYAVGRFYPLAAGARRQIDFAPGELPTYGALGAFGARGAGLDVVDMPMLARDAAYAFQAGRLYNLESSAFIAAVHDRLQGAHSDIAHPEVAHAVWSAAGAD